MTLITLFSLYLQSRKKAKKGDNLDDLKQELDIDYHKISVEELYQRFSTNPDTVSMTVQNIWHIFCLLLNGIQFFYWNLLLLLLLTLMYSTNAEKKETWWSSYNKVGLIFTFSVLKNTKSIF